MPKEPSIAPGITQDQAKKILEADYANMVKKVASGQTLSQAERAIMQSISTGGADSKPALAAASPTAAKFVKNKNALAEALGCTRQHLNRTLKKFKDDAPKPRSDGRWCVAEVREFMVQHQALEGEEDLDAVKLKARQILLQNEKLEFQIKVLQGQYSSNEDIEKWGAELGLEIRKAVTSIHLIAASLAGLPIAEIESRLKEMEDEILSRLHLLGNRITEMKDAKEVENAS